MCGINDLRWWDEVRLSLAVHVMFSRYSHAQRLEVLFQVLIFTALIWALL